MDERVRTAISVSGVLVTVGAVASWSWQVAAVLTGLVLVAVGELR